MIEEHTTLSEKFIKKGVWLYIFSFLLAPLGYIIKIIVSGDLSVEEIGVIYGVLSFITLLGGLNDFGLTESLNYFLPKFITEKRYDKVKGILFYAVSIQFITGFIIACILFFGSTFFSQYVFKDPATKNILEIFSLYFIGLNLFQVSNTFFVSIQNTLYYKLTEFLRMLFVLIFTIYFFMTDLGSPLFYTSSWVLSIYVGILFSFGLFYFTYYKKYLQNVPLYLSKSFFKEIFSYAIVVLLGAQAGTILSQIDMQMILYFLGTKSAGYYSNYLSIITIPFLIVGPIVGFIFPVVSELYGSKNSEKIASVRSLFLKTFIILGISCNFFFLVFAEPVAFVLFGEKFIESGVILKYSILFLTFNFLLQVNFNILAGIGKVKERLKIVSQAIVLNVIMNYILMMWLGVYGASLATGIGWLYIWFLSERVLRKQYPAKIEYLYIIKNIFILGIVSVLFYLSPLGKIDEYTEIGRIQSLSLLLIVVFFWIILSLGINSQETKSFVREVKKVRDEKGAK